MEELMDEDSMRLIARAAARLLDMPGGFAILAEELRRKKMTLAAYIDEHEYHLIDGSAHSECDACMEALFPR